MLTEDDFDDFFAAVNDGHRPFAWQKRLVRHILSNHTWPAQICAPTGTGKSNVVDVHVFVNALASQRGIRVPRRLSLVVNRRAIVDNHEQRANRIAEALSDRDACPVISNVAQALNRLKGASNAPLSVVSLRGGLPPERSWVDDPEGCLVICATPDMWGSRLLFRGYGTSRRARPRESGLLAFDSVMVLDEAHLNRQLLHTARTVAALVRRDSGDFGVPTLQVVETTATPSSSGGDNPSIGVELPDLDDDRVLSDRVRTAKPVELIPTKNWPKKSVSPGLAQDIATATFDLYERYGRNVGGRTIGCFVNRVETAVRVSELLRKAGLTTELRVGPMRPWDLAELNRKKPGLFTVAGDPETDVLIATQTIEVGVDIDLAAAVSELADGSALAQRAGRVNRLGSSSTTVFRVMVPEDLVVTGDYLPYRHIDLQDSLDWIVRRSNEPEGVAPVEILLDPPPIPTLARPALQTLTSANSLVLAQTSTAQLIEQNLDLFLRDSLESEPPSVGIVVRSLPRGDDDALSLLKRIPPQNIEVFPSSIAVVRDILGRVLAPESDGARAFLFRDQECTQLSEEISLQPGDVVIVDSYQKLFAAGVVMRNGQEPAQPVPWSDLAGIHEVLIDPEPEEIVLRSEEGLRFLQRSQALMTAGEGHSTNSSLEFEEGAYGRPTWLVVMEEDAGSGKDMRQQIMGGGRAVALDAHQLAVAQRTQKIGSGITLNPAFCVSLQEAGLHHDDGKTDVRFQSMLGARDEVLAKSGRRTRKQNNRAYQESGLLPGWRHEQLSILLAAAAGVDSPLSLRLIGTSHGVGRPWFPYADNVTADPMLKELRDALFVVGKWNELIEHTDRSFGAWGCAFLESLLRAADAQVSGEGG